MPVETWWKAKGGGDGSAHQDAAKRERARMVKGEG